MRPQLQVVKDLWRDFLVYLKIIIILLGYLSLVALQIAVIGGSIALVIYIFSAI